MSSQCVYVSVLVNSRTAALHTIATQHTTLPCKTFEVRNNENMENTLKIKVFLKSILFCKYLHNRSSDPYEILYGGQYLSCKIMYQIL